MTTVTIPYTEESENCSYLKSEMKGEVVLVSVALEKLEQSNDIERWVITISDPNPKSPNPSFKKRFFPVDQVSDLIDISRI